MRELLTRLGADVLTAPASLVDPDAAIDRVIVAEAGVRIATGDLIVLPPALSDESALDHQVRWIVEAADRGASAVAVRPSTVDHAVQLQVAGTTAGITVLNISAEAEWQRALTQMITALEYSEHAETGSGDEFLRDLFTLADATAIALGGAVAVMNAYSQVIAYSSQPGHRLDDVRTNGILGRQVPAAFVAAHEEVRHWKGGEVRRMDSPGTYPRAAAAVRAGATFLGSVWVILPSDELTPSMETVISSAAKTAAVHLLRYASTTSFSAWRANQSQVRDRLLGVAGPHDAENRIAEDCVVLTVLPTGEVHDDESVMLERLAALVGLVVSGWRGGGCAVLDGKVHALLPLNAQPANAAQSLAETIVRQCHDSLHQPVAVGLSSITRDLPAGRTESTEAARWLSAHHQGFGWYEEIRIQATLARVSEALQAHEIHLPSVRAVIDYDRTEDTDYARTLLAYLEHGQNVSAAAATLFLHPNTLRYRLRRIADLFDLSLEDPDERLAAWIFLRLGDGVEPPTSRRSGNSPAN